MSSTHPTNPITLAGLVFDRLAATYDNDFTNSLIGRAQRHAVWRIVRKTFHPGNNILELNCGTGEDALFLAQNNISVFACDASQQMIVRAEHRLKYQPTALPIVFCHLPTERIAELHPAPRFDGIFSNFSGLNCSADLDAVANSLASLIKPGDKLLLCFSTRFCLTEILYYLTRGNLRKSLRRCRGQAQATLDGASLTIYYPTLRQLRRSFAPNFRLSSHIGIGVAVPPSYLEPWVRRHPTIFSILCRLEATLSTLPILRSTGDHRLLTFEKVSS
ncbi:class I SAM-dependent DNA methyltransferase [Granulicella arctica]|uniref:class I SAM-dependent DNA methyltransferase n=1 Tax=Granulicella arctica TaxID=940613 RepID=UPI0021E03645|nr:class I SAM-dependent methyltransferase [Granulicella arctica]